mgnify:CR=1 FL=1
METFLIRALQLIMSLSLLVIIHEGGHFLFARLFKVRVEKFCFLILGSHYLNLSQRKVRQNMLSVGYL